MLLLKLSERYTNPFLIKVPYTDLRSYTIPDDKITSKMDCEIQGIEVEKKRSRVQRSINRR
jgi:hypothetical protein